MDWTFPVSIATFFLGLLAVLLVGLPRLKVAEQLGRGQAELKDRVHNLAVDLATFKGKDFQRLRQDADDHEKKISSLQNTLAVKRLGG